jgi:hypothetical protein
LASQWWVTDNVVAPAPQGDNMTAEVAAVAATSDILFIKLTVHLGRCEDMAWICASSWLDALRCA